MTNAPKHESTQSKSMLNQAPADNVDIDIKNFADVSSSKNTLYRSLARFGKCDSRVTVTGQIFMPPKDTISIQFIKALLTGQKQYFFNKDVPTVFIEKLQHLTVKNVLDRVYNVPEVRVYLPDYDKHPERSMSREFLFAIVNKVDPTFFQRAQQEIHSKKKAKVPAADKQESLSVKPELMKILEDARRVMKPQDSSNDKRALVSMLATTKKRKRREIEDDFDGLKTEIQLKRLRTN